VSTIELHCVIIFKGSLGYMEEKGPQSYTVDLF